MEFSGRSYRNFNREIFREQLMSCEWDKFYEMEDPDDAWGCILRHLTPILDQMCPVRKYTIKNYRPEWVTNELLEQIKDRDYFYNEAKKMSDGDLWNIARHLRNTTNSNIRATKRDFILNELEQNGSDYKKFWKSIRKVIPDNKGKCGQEILLKQGQTFVEKEDVARHINDFFINVGNQNCMIHRGRANLTRQVK